MGFRRGVGSRVTSGNLASKPCERLWLNRTLQSRFLNSLDLTRGHQGTTQAPRSSEVAKTTRSSLQPAGSVRNTWPRVCWLSAQGYRPQAHMPPLDQLYPLSSQLKTAWHNNARPSQPICTTATQRTVCLAWPCTALGMPNSFYDWDCTAMGTNNAGLCHGGSIVGHLQVPPRSTPDDAVAGLT